MYSIAELAYAAAIVDGEGTISLDRNNKTDKFRQVKVSVSNTDTSIINFMKGTFGGVITRRTSRKPHHKASFVWYLRSNKAIIFLKLIIPYMVSEDKRDRVNYILENYKEVTNRNGKYSEEEINRKLEFERMFFAF